MHSTPLEVEPRLLHDLLAAPLPASSVGALFGVALIAPLAFAAHRTGSGNPDRALGIGLGSSFGGMFVAILALAAYRHFVPEAVWFFGIALGAGYVAGLVVLSVVTAVRQVRDPHAEPSGSTENETRS